MNKELNRLATYTNWPLSSSAWPSQLARYGFYATGDGDTTVCFDCGTIIVHWQRGDDPQQRHRQQAPNCLNSANVPLVPLDDEFDRNVANDGSSQSENLRVNSSTSGDVRDSCVEPSTTRVPTFCQVCRCALDRAKRKGVLATVQRAPATDLENPNFELLRHEAARLVTFTNFPDNSPVTPSTLAKAGFFHKGPGDRVQCAFCRGFLRNWVPGDEPMSEHRRHMPHCPFVTNAAPHGNIRIEDDDINLYSPVPPFAVPAANPQEGVNEVDATALHYQPTFTGLTLAMCKHPQYSSAESRHQTFRADAISLPQGQNIDVLVDAGFFHADNGAAAAEQLQSTAASADTAADNVRSQARTVRKKKDASTDDDELEEDSEPAETDVVDAETQMLLEENKQLHDAQTCRVCMDLEVNTVFLPCGHLVCCDSCAPALRNCAVCRSLIRGTVRVFLT